ncbi:hypothetical protein NE237_020588 [Protea cynaroides]|uniref:Uncharacterized protein n=1 Tax=Protea cynaroides TaxID=273540 RepID=A0A9Q0K415_9MAGN|nr:hypothetical protein NE237_020588 [Protea cynaroides]
MKREKAIKIFHSIELCLSSVSFEDLRGSRVVFRSCPSTFHNFSCWEIWQSSSTVLQPQLKRLLVLAHVLVFFIHVNHKGTRASLYVYTNTNNSEQRAYFTPEMRFAYLLGLNGFIQCGEKW